LTAKKSFTFCLISSEYKVTHELVEGTWAVIDKALQDYARRIENGELSRVWFTRTLEIPRLPEIEEEAQSDSVTDAVSDVVVAEPEGAVST